MTCPPFCPNQTERHCSEHCATCAAARERNRVHTELFDQYLAQRPQPTHTRTWTSQD